MPTVYREAGITFRVYPNDHGPPHVHAVKGSGWAKIRIGHAAGSATVVKANKRLKDRDLIEMVRIVIRERELFLSAWRRVHAEEEPDE